MPSADLLSASVLAGLAVVLGLAYAARFALRGRARSERVDRAGSSPLLGKPPMEAAYWAMDPAVRALVRAGVSANQITGASLALAAASGVALAVGHFGVAAALATAAAGGDALDGLVARRTGTASDAGEVFDAAVDRYSEFLFLAGLAVHYEAEPALLVLTLAALLGCFMVSYSTAKAEALRVEPPRGAMRRGERAVYLVLGATLTPFVQAAAPDGALGSPWLAEAPMLAALLVVGVVANTSAVRRFHAIAAAVRRRDMAPVAGEPLEGAAQGRGAHHGAEQASSHELAVAGHSAGR
jgi:phosphatidylglycerophosphate synthase